MLDHVPSDVSQTRIDLQPEDDTAAVLEGVLVAWRMLNPA